MNINGTIYKILNNVNKMIYIGQTIRPLNERINEYKRDIKYNKLNNNHLLRAFNKYGWENFEFIIIDTANTIEELNEKEIYYISLYKSNDRNFGYNIERGGRNSIPSIETLAKISETHKGIKQNEEWINNRIAKAGTNEAKKYGKEKIEKEKLYLSNNSPKYWLNKNRSEETKIKISETKLKQGFTNLQKEMLNGKVYKIDFINNTIITIYESTVDAGKFEGVHQSTISRWCSKNKIINEILWTYKNYP